MDCSTFIEKTILKRFDTHIKKIKLIEQQNVAEDSKHEVQGLKNDLIESKEITENMIEKNKKSGTLNPEEIRKLKEKDKKLEEKIKNLEEKLKEDEEDNLKRVVRLEREIFKQDGQIAHLNEKIDRHEMKFKNLEIGQILFDFEKDLATYVYPHDKKIGSRKIFTNMIRWLDENKETQEGREANERWNTLQSKLSWSIEREEVFLKLLKFRRPFAHPTVDRKNVLSWLPNDFNDEEEKLIEDIVNMTDRVNDFI